MNTEPRNLFNPQAAQKALVEQTRRALSFQNELVHWQLKQWKTAEEQLASFWKLNLDQATKALDAMAVKDEAPAA